MTIHELFIKNEISIRSFNTCNDNQIYSISDLIDYYLTYGTFSHFRNCGRKTNDELIRIYFKYRNYQNQIDDKANLYSNKNISQIVSRFTDNEIKQLNNYINSEFLNLSVRSANGLKFFLRGNISIDSIQNKVLNHNNFDINQISGIGPRSIPELGFFFKEIKRFILILSNDDFNNEIDKFIDNQDESLLNCINDLTPNQIQIINHQILLLNEKLSVRSKNALLSFLDKEPNLNLLLNKTLLSSTFDLNSIKNIGEISILEINVYLTQIKEFIYEVNNKDKEDEIEYLRLEYFLKANFKIDGISLKLQERNSLLKLIELLIENNSLFDYVDTNILKRCINIFKNTPVVNLQEIGNEINLSGERVRQKRNQIIENLINKFNFFDFFGNEIINRYYNLNNPNFIFISDEISDEINKVDKTNFSKQFLTLILFILNKERFEIIGNIKDVLILKENSSSTRHKWKNIYLIDNNFSSVINFEKLIDNIDYRINQRINNSYKFFFLDYLSDFLKIENKEFLINIAPICEVIINEEFNLFLNNIGELVFERNTLKTISEFAFEALDLLGKPSTVLEIDKQVKILYPDFNKSVSNANLKKEFGFVPYGRQSVFGLKKWEINNENLKSGTIRDIVKEILIDSNVPLHIDDIYIHIKTYRDTNIRSVITNLAISNEFILFPNNYIGLKSKIYDNSKLNFNKINGIYFSNSNLIKFNNFTIDQVLLHFNDKYNYDKKQVMFLLNKKLNNGEIKLSTENKLIINKKNNILETIINEHEINKLDEIIKIIKQGNRLSSYFYFKQFNNYKSKKKCEQVFNYIYNKYKL